MKKHLFNFNFNNKLYCEYFTDIVPRDDSKFNVGEMLYIEQLYNNSIISKGIARIIEIKHINLNKINDFMSFITFSKDKEECIKYLKEYYKKTLLINPNIEFTFVLFYKRKKE
jgi:hypothetical protein